MLIIISGCNKEQKGNMMKLELNCDAENGYVWQTTVLNSNVIQSEGDEFLYKDQDKVLETKQIIRFRALETGTAEIEIKYINAQKENKEKDYSIKYLNNLLAPPITLVFNKLQNLSNSYSPSFVAFLPKLTLLFPKHINDTSSPS